MNTLRLAVPSFWQDLACLSFVILMRLGFIHWANWTNLLCSRARNGFKMSKTNFVYLHQTLRTIFSRLFWDSKDGYCKLHLNRSRNLHLNRMIFWSVYQLQARACESKDSQWWAMDAVIRVATDALPVVHRWRKLYKYVTKVMKWVHNSIYSYRFEGSQGTSHKK